VVILTAFSDRQPPGAIEIRGVASFVDKDGPPSVLVEAVRAAAVTARSFGAESPPPD
jgi:DNA-binding NarL/FixJ family response regulator